MSEYLSKKYIDGVYIPSALLLVGCAIVKASWLPYAALLAVALGGYKIWSSSMFSHSLTRLYTPLCSHKEGSYSPAFDNSFFQDIL